MANGWEHWDYPSHVGMAAVLFRRQPLVELTFRWEPGRCECLCCAHDLRSRGQAIGYLPGAMGWHRPHPGASPPAVGEAIIVSRLGPTALPGENAATRVRARGRVLAAFDRRDHGRFRSQFLKTLRAAGNQETVWAFAYGLFPTEVARLAVEPGVEVIAIPDDGVCPALRRLKDFQGVLKRWPDDMPVAYWDAGDILFQGLLGPLWDQIAAHPRLLHVVAEPLSYPENVIIRYWCDFICDPAARQQAFEVMSTNVFLNSGFAAGTASSLLDYLREGDRLLHSTALAGVGDWGDQPALNLYCHANPARWRLADSAWNYALAGRDHDQYHIGPDGHIRRTDGGPVHALHGNAGSLRWLELMPRTSPF
jgi:hypothetical protein